MGAMSVVVGGGLVVTATGIALMTVLVPVMLYSVFKALKWERGKQAALIKTRIMA
jgi:uncharacterized membrane protein